MPINRNADPELLSALRDAAADYLSKCHPSLDPSRDAATFWRDFAELGWLALPLPSQHGGMDGGLPELSVLFEELGRNCVATPLLDAVLATRILQDAPAVSSDWAASLLDGSQRYVIALAETSRNDGFSEPQCQLLAQQNGLRLNGVKTQVGFASSATHLLVSAQLQQSDDDPGELAICRVAIDAPGLTQELQHSVDDQPVSQVQFLNTPAELLSNGKDCHDILARARHWALVLSMAECVGCMRELNRITCDYLSERKQFKQKLSDFQALRMRVADMHIETELAGAYVQRIAAQPDSLSLAGQTPLGAMGVKTLVANNARNLAQEAIQLHGAIGFTEEALPGQYFKRILALSARFTSASACLHRYATRIAEGESSLPVSGIFSAQDRAFAEQVRNFTRENLPTDIARKVRLGLPLFKDDYVRWQQALHKTDWIAGTWPKQFGGQDWTATQQYIFQSETGRLNAPDVMPYGVKMVGPVLCRFGTPQQQAQHLPGILSSDIWWCQGYSEPNAGSDLAALSTRAERDGEAYIVNGSKIWTTQAHYADWMHCLVRTGQPDERARGISFLMIDMRSPGITVRPIRSIDGLHHLNEVFLENVRVPINQRVGDEGQGWKIAGFLLGNERSALAKMAHKERILQRLRLQITRRRDELEAAGELDTIWQRVAQLEQRMHAIEYLEVDYLGRDDAASRRSYGSLLKVVATELQQELTTLGFDILGHDAARYSRDALSEQQDCPLAADSVGIYEYLYNRAASIYGGTNEIQRTIIAREVFGD